MEVETVELPSLPPDGILVQNDVTAISVGTELYTWVHGTRFPGQPLPFPRGTGGGSAGVVLEVGRDVKDIRPGDRFAALGGHASHAVLGPGRYRKAPDGLSPRSAAYMILAAIAIHGHRVGRPELGESVVVMGVGVVGQLAATFAQLAGGFPVIAVDLDDSRLDKARARGIDVCLNPNAVDLHSEVLGHCAADGVDLVIEATGKPAVYPTALALARTAGRFVALGSPRGSVEISFMPDVHLREVRIFGAIQPKTPDKDHIYYPWTQQRDRDLILQLMAAGKLPVEDLITHSAKPEDCQAIYDMLADRPQEALGVVFEWT